MTSMEHGCSWIELSAIQHRLTLSDDSVAGVQSTDVAGSKETLSSMGLGLLMLTQSQVPTADITVPLISTSEQSMIDLTNQDRVNNGEMPLVFDAALLTIARQRANDSLTIPVLSHYDVDGNPIFVQMMQSAGLEYSLVGENIARSATVTQPASIETLFMASESHRKNILDPGFGRLAIGEANGNSGQSVYVEIFRNP